MTDCTGASTCETKTSRPPLMETTTHPVVHLAPKDWNDAYNHAAHTKNFEQYTVGLFIQASNFRSSLKTPHELNIAYGPDDRHRYDMFWPAGGSGSEKGVVIYLHGGSWIVFSKDGCSQLAAGPLELGWAVAVVNYRLTPQVRIREITQDVAMALNSLSHLGVGPIRLVGHSAGGHLVCRMMCTDVSLSATVLDRLDRVITLGGVADLRPFQRLARNAESLHLDDEEARLESPVLCTPRANISLVAVAGDEELPEFIRQTVILPLVWQGLGVDCYTQIIVGESHFSLVEQLEDSSSQLCSLLDGPLST